MSGSSALVQRVVERASIDSTFRSRLMANPKAAVESELGISIPADLTVKVFEERPDEFFIVLPPKETGNEPVDTVFAGAAGGDPFAWSPNRVRH